MRSICTLNLVVNSKYSLKSVWHTFLLNINDLGADCDFSACSPPSFRGISEKTTRNIRVVSEILIHAINLLQFRA